MECCLYRNVASSRLRCISNEGLFSSPATAPVISECEGSYEYIKSKSQLLWTIAVIDESNKSGTLEFTTENGQAGHFFPVNMRFTSNDLYCDVAVGFYVFYYSFL